ncbi:MAG TPA: IS1595 family transposase [Rhizomicrobium sp.]|nr:IS1595 family transposase [Rhizomicrobium sp.]
MTFDLNAPMFKDEAAAIAHMEADRWPNGVTCLLCGGCNRVHKMGGATQAGMFVCYDCNGKFTVRTGTVFERSHIPLHKWLLATYLMGASKKGISAHQLHRMLGITYKSAWFMAMRIREAMAPAAGDKLGGSGKVVEADETEVSPSRKSKKRPRHHNKRFVSLVERGGKVRSVVIDGADSAAIRGAIARHVDPASTLHTDGAQVYRYSDLPAPAGVVASHEAVDHNKEYVRKGKTDKVHTNTAEGYFSIFKRGLVGTYQHIGEQHLPRYLAEFDFRQNNRARLGVGDAARAARILKGAEGKRLTYRQPH